ncbi:RMD1 family protein [Petroclostridium sp. X23]|uniref:RMD1 family protein n=1 Tax=Petroclostridium sp. X23 TaxID=3045146 RepID=UPI0024AC827C|nr:RMD1 family protein [Petroclostridium sp. X23]WHH57309.1 RMD1 family protein [Petroclostridium sp. X23]
MNDMTFKAYAVTNEIDLNKIAARCNIPKKYTWEEPLVLQGDILASILKQEISPEQRVMVFAFGSIVFINAESHDIQTFIEYIKTFKNQEALKDWDKYTDDYKLHVGEVKEMELTDEYVTVSEYLQFYPELISTVIAKSVALEKTEEQLGKILDKLESMIVRLERGRLRISDKELAKTTARIVKHEYNTIAYIMILDKPDITWLSSDAAELYDKMSEFFELNDRFEILKSKTSILNNILDGFTAISHSIRGIFVEWVIVILIVMEVILMLIDLIR